MEKIIFEEAGEGLSINRIVRDHEYSMPSKHFHDSYEFYFLLEGERYYFIDKDTYWVKKGMAVLVNRHQIHRTIMADKSYHDRILMMVDARQIEGFLEENHLITLNHLFSEYGGLLQLQEQTWQHILNLLTDIKNELHDKERNYEKIIKLKLAELVMLLQRCSSEAFFQNKVKTVQSAKYQKVSEVADYLLKNYETEESIEDIAERFFISKSYLCRIFKEVTGFTVNEYLNTTRIKKAQDLLVFGEKSITEIAGMLGFESITYFERVFKKHTDMTPMKYRKLHRSQSSTHLL